MVRKGGKVINLKKIPTAKTGSMNVAPRAGGKVGSFNNDGTFSQYTDNANWWNTEAAYLGDDATDDSTGTTAPADTSTPSWLNTALQAIGTIGTSVAQIQQAKSINSINLQRAQQGLPAFTADQLPTASVQLGVSPTIKNVMYIGAGLLGALLVYKMVSGKRR